MPAANLRMISPNAADDAVLTASPAMVATLPVTNLQEQSREPTRSTVIENQHIHVNFNEVKLLSSMALVGHNFTAAAEFRLRLYEGLDRTGALSYDSGVQSVGSPLGYGDYVYGVDPYGGNAFLGWPIPYSELWFPPVKFALSADLEMSDLANPAGYLSALRLVMGEYFSPATNFRFGISMTWVDASTQQRTDGGGLRTDAAESYRRLEFELDRLTLEERAALAAIMRRAGKRDDLFVSCYPGWGGELERDHAGLFKFTQDASILQRGATSYQSRTMVLEEA